MHRILLALACASTFATTPAWAVNKCKGPDGKTVFQDTPCADGSGERVRINSNGNPVSPSANADAKQSIANLKAQNDMAAAIRERRPLVGMTLKQLNEAMGTPTRVNADNVAGNTSDQVIFERSNETWLVYTRNGVVESIQHRPGAPIGYAPAERSSRRCPTNLEIENAKTSASSITLTDAQRAEKMQLVRDMQSCK